MQRGLARAHVSAERERRADAWPLGCAATVGSWLSEARHVLPDGNPRCAPMARQRAEGLRGGVGEVALWRGVALEKLQRTNEAVAAYRTAMERDPQGRVGAAASRRLQALGYGPPGGLR